MTTTENELAVLQNTKHWLERAVIGLNLCPFAKSVYVKEQVRYVICDSQSEQDVLEVLEAELLYLADVDAQKVDTSLLVLPNALADFFEFNHFLDRATRMLKQTKLRGVLQIASFHPRYQFGDNEPEDIENYTNRAPYPILHLLREASVEQAVAAFPDAAAIYERNQETLRRLGHKGWQDWLNKPSE